MKKTKYYLNGSRGLRELGKFKGVYYETSTKNPRFWTGDYASGNNFIRRCTGVYAGKKSKAYFQTFPKEYYDHLQFGMVDKKGWVQYFAERTRFFKQDCILIFMENKAFLVYASRTKHTQHLSLIHI